MSVPRSHRNRHHRHLAAVGPDRVPPRRDDDPAPGFWDPVFAARDDRPPELFAALLPYVDDITTLLDLDTDPLPDEPFDWSHVDEQDTATVAAVLDRCDAACDALLDVEFRTIARRILALLATRDPRPLRRTSNADRLAAGIVWLAGHANGEFGRHAPRWRSATALWQCLGVGNCSDRGHSIRNATGLVPNVIDPYPWDTGTTPVGTVALLHSRTRRSLIARRDAYLRIEQERRRWSISPDGRSVELRAALATPLAATRGRNADDDQAVVIVALGPPGTGLDEADLYGLALPDARRLVDMLRRAINPH